MATPGPNYTGPLTSQASVPQGSLINTQQGSVGGASTGGGANYNSPTQTGGPAGGIHQQSFPVQVPAAATQPQMMSPNKSVNSVSLCKLGQETNQELVNKLLDVFKQFKTMQLPNGTNSPLYHERRAKMEEGLRGLSILFKKLRVIYDKVSELIIDPDDYQEEVLVPLIGEPLDEKNTKTDAYKYGSEEYKLIVEQLQQKNREIKEVIDKIRTIMWEINTMIVMRKT